MNSSFFFRCFIVGLSSTCGIGPIFILIVNRSTLYGFLNGFATALGASIADSLFFFLSLIGALNFIEKYKNFIFFAESISGFAVLAFGLFMIQQKIHAEENAQAQQSLFLTIFRSFLLTLLSPFVAFFFMFASIRIVPSGYTYLTIKDIITASGFVGIGSLLGLSSIAFVAGSLRKNLKKETLNKFGFYSGLLFITIGSYLILDSILKIKELL